MMKWPVALFLCWTVTVTEPPVVIDGDTFDSRFSVWLASKTREHPGGAPIMVTERVRVLGIDTPECKKRDKKTQACIAPPEAVAASTFTVRWSNNPFFIYTCERDSFGRILGVVYREVDTSGGVEDVVYEHLSDKLRESGYDVNVGK